MINLKIAKQFQNASLLRGSAISSRQIAQFKMTFLIEALLRAIGLLSKLFGVSLGFVLMIQGVLSSSAASLPYFWLMCSVALVFIVFGAFVESKIAPLLGGASVCSLSHIQPMEKKCCVVINALCNKYPELDQYRLRVINEGREFLQVEATLMSGWPDFIRKEELNRRLAVFSKDKEDQLTMQCRQLYSAD